MKASIEEAVMRKIREFLLKGMISFAIVPIALAIGVLPAKGLVMVAQADGNAGTFADLQGIIDETEDKGTITLEKDYTAEPEEGHLLIPANKELTIDLNGHTVDGSARTEEDVDLEAGEIRAVLVVGENCVLTLSDNSMDATGEIIGEKGEISKWAMLVYGKCTMNGGTITGKLSVGEEYDKRYGSFTMNGGRITGSQNVYVARRAGFEMTAGEIHIENAGCVINNASDTAGFKMSGGKISGQYVSSVVFVGGSFTMSDGTISGENVTDCIVYAADTFIMSGGTVSGSGQNGGVFVEKPLDLKISGSPTITGGICLSEQRIFDQESLVEVTSSLITVTGKLTNTDPITVIPQVKPKTGSPIVITSGLTENGGPNAAHAFSCGVEGLIFIEKDGELAVAKSAPTEWDALQELVEAGGTVTLDKDYSATIADDTLIIPKTVDLELDLNGHTVDGSALERRNVSYLEPGLAYSTEHPKDPTTLEIKDSGSGGKITCGTNGLVYEIPAETAISMSGGTIEGQALLLSFIRANSYLYMTGGEIICNRVSSAASSDVVRLEKGNFTMTGGSISGTGYESVIDCYGACHTTMRGGTITGANVTNVIELGDHSDFTISGGTIDGSSAANVVAISNQPDIDLSTIRFAVSGSPTIKGRVALAEGLAVTVAGALGSDISVSSDIGSVIARAGTGYTLTESDAAHFKNYADANSNPVLVDDTVLFNKFLTDPDISIADIPPQTYTGSAIVPAMQVKDKDALLVFDRDYNATLSNNVYTGTASVTLAGKGGYYVGERTVEFSIVPKPITISGIKAKDKEYDGSTAAELDYSEVSYEGICEGDSLSVNAIGTFDNANAGQDKNVTISGLTLGGTSIENYVLASEDQQKSTTASIAAIPVYITGVTAKSRVFNGGTDAEISGTAILKRGSNDEEVTGLTASDITASFADMNTGSNKAVSITGCTLSDPCNYTLDTDKTNEVLALKADITKATMSDPPSQRTKRYLYSRDNADSYPLGLPADCGILSCNTLETTGGVAYDPAPSVSDAGVLSYTVKKGNLGTTGTISINAVMQNYNDVPLTIDIMLVGQLSVKAEDDVTLNNTLTYGQKLSALQFEPVGFVTDDEFEDEVAGTLAWKERDSVPDVQTTSATWVFTPDDPQFYAGCEGTVAITVNKADIPAGDITAPSAETLSYNALEQDLIKAGSVRISTCTMKYYHAAVEDPDNPPSAPDDPDLYSPSIPKATGAGTYYVWYMVDGDDNYNNWTEEKLALKAFITPREVGLKWSDTSFTYDGEEHCPSAYCEGLIYGDKCDVTVTGGAVNANAAGESYTATAAGLTNSDYKLPENKTVKFRIEKAAGPDAPTGLAGVVPTWDGVSDGKITGVTVAMEYSADLISWTACTGTEVTGLLPGTYHVRVKETGNYEAGKSAAVAVPEPDPEVLELDLPGLPGADGKDVRLSVARSSAPIYYDGKKHVVKDTFLYHYPEERAVEGTGLKDSQKKTTSANILIKVDGLTPMYKVSYVYKDNKNASAEKPYFYLKLALDKKSEQYKALGKKEKSAVSKALSKANKELKKEGNRIKFEILKRDISTFTHDPDRDTHGKNSAVVFKDAEGNLLTVNLGFTKKKGVTMAKIKNVKMSYINKTEKPSYKVITEGKKQIARSIVNGEDGTFTISLEGCTTGKNLNYTGVLTYTGQ